MRLSTTFSVLLASIVVAPSVLAFPLADSGFALEARAVEYDSDVFARGVDFGDELYERSAADDDMVLLARALVDALKTRDDPPGYHKHDPNNGKKPKYTSKDPAPIPKYRQKDPHKPPQPKKPSGGGGSSSRRIRDLGDFDGLEARDDPPKYSKHDPNNGKKPKYTAKDPAPIPKYRQKDPHKPPQPKKPRSDGSSSWSARDFVDIDGLEAREDSWWTVL
ncbi:hypothetical protein EVJ58_g496 [Rhodofomes roseus]|uniref:Uncharacterized protein n=1 Tax=Rhodofomes roseus TaxID=34475 RepID=A0A4Y9Z402_9APHY|nr:hypothetical protein EVJ58_g496 [Rhodofomes roseus]